MKAYILFLIIANGDGGVVTEKFSTNSLESCNSLLTTIKEASKAVTVYGVCIR